MLGWAATFLIIAADSGSVGIWWDRSCVGRNRKDLILHIPGDVRDLFYFWLAWQRSSLIRGRVWLVSLWRSASRRLVACSYTVKARVRPLVSQAL